GRPRTVWLRRAVSAAYYSVFHGIALATTKQLAPSSSREDWLGFCRSIEHHRLVEVCSWIGGRKAAAGKEHVRLIVSRLRSNPDVRELAGIVGRLQQERHRADYDHLSAFEKREALTLVEEAERALR